MKIILQMSLHISVIFDFRRTYFLQQSKIQISITYYDVSSSTVGYQQKTF